MRRFNRFKRILGAILCLTILFSLYGCMPSAFSESERSELEAELKTEAERWLEKNEPDAEITSCKVDTGFANNDEYGDVFGYTLTDILRGTYSVSGESHEVLYVRSSDTMYLQDYESDAEEIVYELYRNGLGFTEDDITKVNQSGVYFNDIPHKVYYDEDDDGDLESQDAEESYPYFPSDLKESEVKDFVLDGLLSGDVSTYFIEMHLEGNIDINDLNLSVVRDYPDFGEIMIYTDELDYHITVDESENAGKNKKIITILTMRTIEASDSDASSQNKKPTTEYWAYEYDFETLEYIRDYDASDD